MNLILDLRNNKVIVIIFCALFISTAFIFSSVFSSDIEDTDKISIGVADGIPSVIMKCATENYGEDKVETEKLELYNFQDC